MFIPPLSNEVEDEINSLVSCIRVACHHFVGEPDYLSVLQHDFPVPFSLSGNIVSLSSSDARKLLLAGGFYASQESFDDFLSRRMKPVPGVSFDGRMLSFDLSVRNGLGFGPALK